MSAQDVHVEVVYLLTAVGAVVDYDPESFGTVLLADLACLDHHVAEKLLVLGLGLGEMGEAVLLLRDEQIVHRSLGVDVLETVTQLVLIDHAGRDLFLVD